MSLPEYKNVIKVLLPRNSMVHIHALFCYLINIVSIQEGESGITLVVGLHSEYIKNIQNTTEGGFALVERIIFTSEERTIKSQNICVMNGHLTLNINLKNGQFFRIDLINLSLLLAKNA